MVKFLKMFLTFNSLYAKFKYSKILLLRPLVKKDHSAIKTRLAPVSID